MPEWNEAQTVRDLSDALRTYDWSAAKRICEDLIRAVDAAPDPYPEKAAKQILAALRRKRLFDLMQRTADAFIRGGQASAQIRRQYAQAMIDSGILTAPVRELEVMLSDVATPAAERAEASGLLGRIHKQIYVNGNDASNPRLQRDLRAAIQRYYDVYKTDPAGYLWHGINTVALLDRAERDKVMIEGGPDKTKVATNIKTVLDAMDTLEYWDRATAVECAVALGDWKSAYDHALYYVADPKVDAFECGSLKRQLEDVWQLSLDKEPGNTLLPLLRATLAKLQGTEIKTGELQKVVEQNKQAEEGLQKVFGVDRYQPFGWASLMIKRFQAVARIESLTGRGIGTGFLVRAADFFPGRDEKELILLTNSHVISPPEKPFVGSLTPAAAQANFEANGKTYKVADLLWSSPPGEYDATFVTLAGFPGEGELCPLEPPADAFNPSLAPKVYVIGYPKGGGLSISLQDSAWLDRDLRVLHYRTPTEGGSSGSPVFDQSFWTLIALHHRGLDNMPRLNGVTGTYQANEGIAIEAIQAATRKSGVMVKVAGAT